MSSFDVIVVGGGPAGATAAAEAASAGLRVALLEKRPLPRHKTCGGGMPMTVGDTLRDLVPGAFVESNVTYMRHTYQWDDAVLSPINPLGTTRPITIWMVQRSIFDNALVERAAKAGAEVIDDCAVKSIRVEGSEVFVEATSGMTGGNISLSANQIIGADGANGVTAKFAELRAKRTLAIGMELEHPHTWGRGHPDLRPEVVHLEYGAVPGGYAWIFPKGDHLNVGAGFFRARGENTQGGTKAREELQRSIFAYLDLLGVPYNPDSAHFYAHPLPLWNGREQLHSRDARILLAGDAAGMVNPFFGDGILHAIRTGKLAAQCIVDGQPEAYSRRVYEEHGRNMEGAEKIAKVFYRWPALCYRMGVKRESATHTAARLLCGDAMFDDVSSRVMNKVKKALTPGAFARANAELK